MAPDAATSDPNSPTRAALAAPAVRSTGRTQPAAHRDVVDGGVACCGAGAQQAWRRAGANSVACLWDVCTVGVPRELAARKHMDLEHRKIDPAPAAESTRRGLCAGKTTPPQHRRRMQLRFIALLSAPSANHSFCGLLFAGRGRRERGRRGWRLVFVCVCVCGGWRRGVGGSFRAPGLNREILLATSDLRDNH